jgi:lipopolysaccharide export LptBFGC system permease protein LptF
MIHVDDSSKYANKLSESFSDVMEFLTFGMPKINYIKLPCASFLLIMIIFTIS